MLDIDVTTLRFVSWLAESLVTSGVSLSVRPGGAEVYISLGVSSTNDSLYFFG